jgi:hypothetical protein
MYSFFDGADAVCGQLPPADDERSRGERIDRGSKAKIQGKRPLTALITGIQIIDHARF